MIRKTSVESYDKIREQGLLKKLKWEIYDFLYRYGPLTQAEVWYRHFRSGQLRSISPRFSELQKFGVIATVDQRKCTVSGATVLVWDVTGKLPVKPEKAETKDQKISRLEEEIERLKTLSKQVKYEPMFIK